MSRLGGIARWITPAGVPFAWRQLCFDRNRLLAATCGIILAVTSILFQTGAYNALFASVATQYLALNADLVMHSANYKYVVVHAPFSRDRIAAVLADPDVESAEGVRAAVGLWRSPETGEIDQMLVFGVEPSGTAFNLSGLQVNRLWLGLPTTVLYDQFSLPQFGDIEGRLSHGEACPVEINGLHCEVRGTLQLGISFTANGQAFMSKIGFDRVFAGLPPYAESLGLIRLRPDARPEKVRDRLQARLGPDMLVLTKKQLVEAEQRYWNGRTPVGFIIPVTLLVVVLVGAVIFYQILYTDVQSHLPEYATLKAIGFKDWNLQFLVVQQSMWLSLLGFPPGLLLAFLLFRVARATTHLPFALSVEQGFLAFFLTFGMCLAAGFLAMLKLRHAQPADVFL
ncbi:MAG: FtsX-like permease family protein [Verrucomicrobia bacterium]|nr:FtsX-like permease family protein [Verrucomicrobiota bacterium]